jgi:RNA polymerase sigma-70 factor (ECF subfamily)
MAPPDSEAASEAAERAARLSYGRLLAILAARTRDVALAEEVLANAFARALETWPRQGVPQNPEGWLLTVARNDLSNLQRHDRVRAAATAELILRAEEATEDTTPDDRLSLLFVCAHPAIDPAARAPLMLQTVLGLDAARIAAAFLVSPAAMGQRLVRAKTRIRDAGLRFAPPDAGDLPERLPDVLEAIYAALGTAWDRPDGSALPGEAIHLARVLHALLPGDPEVKGLLALMLYIHARRAARGTDRFIPLSDQDARLWDRAQVIEAEGLLTSAAAAGRFGRFQCEAAIQSVHVQRAITGRLNLTALDMLHGLLRQHLPTAGATVAHAAIRREMGDLPGARALLDSLPPALAASWQPSLVLNAHLLRDTNDPAAPAAAAQALAATEDPRLRAHLAGVFGLD